MMSTLSVLGLLACGDDATQADRDAAHGPAAGSGDAGSNHADAGGVDGAVADAATEASSEAGLEAGLDAASHEAGSASDSGVASDARASMDGSGDGATDAGWQGAALPSLDGVDLGLGGLNQDLAPSGDCLSDIETYAVCLDLNGEFDGQRFERCDTFSQTAGTGLGNHGFGCDVQLPSGALLEVSVNFSADLIGMLPSTFSFAAPPQQSRSADVYADVSWDGGQYFNTSQAREDGDIMTDVRLSAVAGYGPGALPGAVSQFERGSFALTATPTASCDPAGNACHRVRMRGNFTARTVAVVPAWSSF
jgi:hypothetical protein